MKPRRLVLTRALIPFAAAVAAMLTAHSARAASAIWNGTTDALWKDPTVTYTNWNNAVGAEPGTGNTATFNNAGGADDVINLGAGVTIQQITFDTASAAAYTIGSGGIGAQTLSFNAGGITVNSNVAADQLIHANIVLGTANGNLSYAFTNNSTTNSLTSAGGVSSTTTGIKTLTVSGAGNTALSGALTNGTGTLALAKTGAGLLTLSSTGNTYTGGTTVGANSADGGIIRTLASDVLPAGNLVLVGGTIDLNGNSDTVGTGSGTAIYFGATSGPLSLGRTSTLSTGAGTLTLAGNIVADSNAKQQMVITGKLNLGAASRDIQNHTYTSGVGSAGERVQIRIEADISGTGVGVNLIRGNDGSATVGARFSGNNTYTGTTALKNAALEADNANALGNGGNITFSDGGGAILKYTANSAATDWSTRFKSSTGQPIRLDTNSQTVTLAGIIDNTNTQGLSKLGAGNLILSAPNTYSGNTTVNAGTLKTAASNVIPNASSVVVSGNAAGVTATFDLDGNSDTINGLSFGGSTATSGAALTTGAGILTLGNNVTYDATGTPLGATLSGNLELGAATRTFTINDSSSAADDLTVSAAITGGVGVGLIKSGTGKLVLSGTNSYPGATLSNGGLLQFNSLASMAGVGRNITATSPGAVGVGYVPGTTIQADLLSRIVSSSTGAAALTANTGESIDFSSGGPGNNFTGLSLGASGNVTYSGTLTPNGTTYRLGSAGGTLTMANAIAGAGNTLVINGNVILSTTSDFSSTTINSGSLQLNMGAMTNVTNNGALVFDFSGSQSYTGTISGTGSLTKNGSGTLTLTVPQTYSGTTTINAGTLILAAGDHTLNANKTIAMTGGSTLNLGSNDQYVGQLTSTSASDIITGTGARLTTNSTGAATIAGSIQGSIDLVKVGAQTLTMTANSTTTGTVSVLGGGLTLKDNGVFSANTGLTVNGATLTLDNTGTANINGRVNSAALALNGGTVNYLGRASTASTETLGGVTLESGVSIVSATPGSGTASAVLTMTSLIRNNGAALNVNPGNASNLGTTTNPYGNVLVTTFNGSNLTAVNGVIPGVFSVLQDAWYLTGYDNTKGFGILGTAGFPANYTGTYAAALATSNLNGVAAVVNADNTINSFNQAAMSFTNGTATGGTDLLTIASGMTIMRNEVWGSATQRGRITSGTQELFIGHRDGNATPDPIVHSVIVDKNGGTAVSASDKVSLVVYSKRGDRGPYLWLTAANLYSGGTYATGGNALGGILINATTATDVVIPAGGLTINNQGVVDMIQGKIDPSNIVTINGNGQLNLSGTNTLAGLVFNSNGGTSAPSVTPYITQSGPPANSFTTKGAKTGTLVITGNISSTPTNVAVTPLIDSGTLDLNGTSAHDISVAALPEGNFINALTPLNGLQISSIIANGGFTKKGAGVLNLTSASSTYSGQLTVAEGVLNVPTVNNASANGVLGNSASAVTLGASGKTGTLELNTGSPTSSKPFTLASSGSGAFQVDLAASNLTLSGLIDGSGSLIKTGLGTLTLTNASNSYSGNTSVLAGKLSVNAAYFADASTVTIGGSAGAIAVLKLDHANTDTVDKLFIDGVQMPAGTYGSTASTATNQDNNTFDVAGAGVLNVLSGPGATPYDTWALGKGLTGANNAVGDDPDKDGISNLAEFAFNGDPLSGADKGLIYMLLEDSDAAGDPSAADELILTVAVRKTSVFTAGAPATSALIDGITYRIDGGTALEAFTGTVKLVPTVLLPGGAPNLGGSNYEYRSFSLDGSDALPGKGFFRAAVIKP